MDDALADHVRLVFGEDADAVLEVLAEFGTEPHHREVTRVQRAIVTLSAGDVDKLLHYTSAAMLDHRDVLWWADAPVPPEA